MVTTNEGEVIPWHAYSIGKLDSGRAKDRAIVTTATASQKLSWKNNILIAIDVDAAPNFSEFSGNACKLK